MMFFRGLGVLLIVVGLFAGCAAYAGGDYGWRSRGDYSSLSPASGQEKEDNSSPLGKGWVPKEELLETYGRTEEEQKEYDELYEQSMMLAEDTLLFEWKKLVLHVIALAKDSLDLDRLVVPYMKVFYPKEWQRYHQDEFEFGAQKKIYKEKLDLYIEDFNPDVKYGVFSGYEFGRYDFEEGKFIFQPFRHNSYLATTEMNSYGLPQAIKVFFVNYDKIDGILMEQERAKRFIANRRNERGNIDRKVWGYLTFQIESLYRGKVSDNNVARVIAKIRSLTLYNDSRREEILTIYTFD